MVNTGDRLKIALRSTSIPQPSSIAVLHGVNCTANWGGVCNCTPDVLITSLPSGAAYKVDLDGVITAKSTEVKPPPKKTT